MTSNEKKNREFGTLLSGNADDFQYVTLSILEIKDIDQGKVVTEKAKYGFEQLKSPVLVDDTAIYFSGYNKFPGTFTKYIFNTLGSVGLNRLLSGGMRGSIRTIVCYYDGKAFKYFEGSLLGSFKQDMTGNQTDYSEYNGFFYPDGFEKKYADFSESEILLYSPRALAVRSFLESYNKGVL